MPLSDNGKVLRLKDGDHVAVALRALEPGGDVVFGAERVPVVMAIPAGHKIAMRAIAAGEPILKYGEIIGRATAPIAAGEHVHVHNVEGIRGRGDLAEASP